MGSCTDHHSGQLRRPPKISLFVACNHPDEHAVFGTAAYSRACNQQQRRVADSCSRIGDNKSPGFGGMPSRVLKLVVKLHLHLFKVHLPGGIFFAL